MKIVPLFLCLFLVRATNCFALEIAAIKPGWKLLKNHFGWSMQYPGYWGLDEGDGDKGPEDDNPVIYGTIEAAKLHQQIGWVIVNYRTSFNEKFSLKSIVEGTHGSNPVISEKDGHESKVGGFPAYDEVITESQRREHSQSRILRKIAINKNGALIKIEYYEGGTGTFLDRDKWKNEKLFDEMLSTFRFTK